MHCIGALNLTFAQETTKFTSYFDSDSYTLSNEEKYRLEFFINNEFQPKFVSNIKIIGHTDSDANDNYNQILSEKRVQTILPYFTKNVSIEKIESHWEGETQPLNKNASQEEKKLNRRVEIIVSYINITPVADKGSIKGLYKKLEQEKQRFCISPKGDTTLILDQGTIVYFPEYPFGKIEGPCIEILAKEFYKKSDMIMENLSTTSNGNLLESAGMVYLEAKSGEKTLDLASDKKVLVMMPADSLREDMQGFNGERDPHTDIINWVNEQNSEFNLLRMPPGTPCQEGRFDRPVDNCEKCAFFFCRVKRIDDAIEGVFNRSKHLANKTFRACQRKLRRPNRILTTVEPRLPEQTFDCSEMDSLFKAFGVSNYNELVEAMNKDLMDKYGVKTLRELQDTLQKIKIAQIENNLLSGKINQNELQYYMYNTSRLGWINTDAFSKLSGKRIAMLTDLKQDAQTDCKVVFTGVRGVLPAHIEGGYFHFLNTPEGYDIWLIGMRFVNNEVYLSMKKTKSTEKVEMAPFRKVTLQELKEALKTIN